MIAAPDRTRDDWQGTVKWDGWTERETACRVRLEHIETDLDDTTTDEIMQAIDIVDHRLGE